VYAFAEQRKSIDVELLAQVIRDRVSAQALRTYTGGERATPAPGVSNGGSA
jgi:hypothetical protein